MEPIRSDEWVDGYNEGFEDAKSETAQDSYEEGYEQGYDDGYTQIAAEEYQRGYDTGYDEGIAELEYEVTIAREDAYEEGYADGERMLYSIDNPLEVITELEYEVNLVLTHPETYSAQEALESCRTQFQRLLRDWGQYVNDPRTR